LVVVTALFAASIFGNFEKVTNSERSRRGEARPPCHCLPRTRASGAPWSYLASGHCLSSCFQGLIS